MAPEDNPQVSNSLLPYRTGIDTVRTAILSDIYGNSIALEAVLSAAIRMEVETFWILGDHVAIGYNSVAGLERLIKLPNAVFIRGNTNRYIVTDQGPPPTLEEVTANPELVDTVKGYITAHGWFDWLASLSIWRVTLLSPEALTACSFTRHRAPTTAKTFIRD